jgi:hypothetical protein
MIKSSENNMERMEHLETISKETSAESVQDTVLFMSVYKSFDSSSKLILPWKKRYKIKDLFAEHHISSLMISDLILTPKGNLTVKYSYDPAKQQTKFNYDIQNPNDNLKNYVNDINGMKWCSLLAHASNELLNESYFKLRFFVSMDSFLVRYDTGIYQVDPIIFLFSDFVFVNFELINYITKQPLTKNDIYGKVNNYNQKPVIGVKFFADKDFLSDGRNIPDIIHENIVQFVRKYFNRDNVKIHKTPFHIHNLFVVSNDISNIHDYFLKVIGLEKGTIELENISTTRAYDYYSQEYLGVATSILKKYEDQALFDVQLFEALKMYITLNQIINLNTMKNSNDAVDRQMSIDQLMLVRNVPIITEKTLKNIQKTTEYKLLKEATELQISRLKVVEERRKNKSALWRNILLYFLSLISSIKALQVLQEEFAIPFKLSFIALMVFFGIWGFRWIFLEKIKLK